MINFGKLFIRMKKLITPVLFLLFSLSVFAQTLTNDYSNPKAKLNSLDRVSASISTGAGFSISNSPNSFYSSYVASKIGYQLTKRIKLNVGLMHYTLTGSRFKPITQDDSFLAKVNEPFGGNLIYVQGQFQLTPRLIIAGTVVRSLFNNYAPNAIPTSFNSTTLGFQYKISDKASFGIGTTISTGNPNYNNDMNTRMPGNTNFSNGFSPFGMFPAFGQY